MMMMTEEKHTPNAVAFVIEMPNTGSPSEKDLSVKQRLEAESAAFAPQTSLEMINAKLEKAEEKRKMSMQNHSSEEKRKRVIQRKMTLEEAALEKKEDFESHLSMAEKKREDVINNKLAKVHEHLSKVDQIRKSKSIMEQNMSESLTETI
jgi:hypothetical protein